MGVDQGYTEKDIVQAARALTGYTYDHFNGQFRFVHTQHDPGDKTIFGKKGPWTGDDLVRLILDQPTTSRFVAQDDCSSSLSIVTQTRKQWKGWRRCSGPISSSWNPCSRTCSSRKSFTATARWAPRSRAPSSLVVGLLRDLGC